MIKIRPMSPHGDQAEAFVFSAWTRSYMAAATGGDDGDPPTELAHYFVRANVDRAQGALVSYIRDLIVDHGAIVYVAHAEDDAALFLGFICCTEETTHYLYVKKRVRRRGVATALLAHAESEHGLMMQRCTTITWPWTLEWATQRLGLDYCPVIGDPPSAKPMVQHDAAVTTECAD